MSKASQAPAGNRFPGARLACAVCHTPLNRDQEIRGQVCARAECHQKRATQMVLEGRRRDRELRARATEIAHRLGLTKAVERAVGLIPSNDRPLTNNPKRRVDAYRDHLTRKITEAFSDRTAKPPPRYPPTGLPKRDERLLGKACGTCRGYCCSQGGTHGFVGAGTILRYLAMNPNARPRDVLADYLSRIPPRSYRNSCVFHTEGGCALPREMRSSTCNHYLCKGLWEFHAEFERLETRSGLALALDGEEIVRAAGIDDSPEFGSNPPEVP